MRYIPNKGWVEFPDFVVTENTEDSFARQRFDAEQALQIIRSQIKNVTGYANYCEQQFKNNPNDDNAIKTLTGLSEYLSRHIGPGAIGDFRHNA